MKYLALVIAYLGIAALTLLLFLSPPKVITSKSEINNMEVNQLVTFTGKVISQTPSSIKLDNNISISCDNCTDYESANIRVTAKVQEYKGKYLKLVSIKLI